MPPTNRFTCFVCGFPLAVDDLDRSCSGCDFPLRPEDFGLSAARLARLREEVYGAFRRVMLSARQVGPVF